jgi:staphylococcal nuclease domain-containing protein 1
VPQWYRAKVLKRQQGKVEVFFIDYGNKDITTDDQLRPLDPTLSPQVISAQAVECRLAHLIVSDPTDGADGQDAANTFSGQVWGKPLLARIEDRKAGVLHVTLFVDAQTNINEQLVAAGLARVEKTASKRSLPLLQALQEKERGAKAERNGMWTYGDIDDDDD